MGTKRVELSAGTVEYEDTGGAGPVVVLLHGLLMDSSLWHEVIAGLCTSHRCIAPTLPLGAHSTPMRDGADLTPHGLARLVGEFLERLDLTDVVLVGNDTGGALVQLMLGDADERIGSIVLVSCEAYDNFPPGLTGKTIVLTGKLPPALFGLFMQQLRLKPVRRLPIAFGWLTKRGDTAVRQWLRPVLGLPAIRCDTVRVLRGIAAQRRALLEAAERLRSFDRPALVVWASGDKVMPPAHGRRLAEELPRGRLVELADGYSLLPLDQPEGVVRVIREFTR